MADEMFTLTYGACAVLIAVYAWGRFNTPPSNRSSTRQALYWWSAAGYVLSALALFVALSLLLKAGSWRSFLLGKNDNAALPAPLIATLALTTLLPSVPLLKRIDEWFLAVFLDWAEIPGEVKRRAAAMTPHSYQVSPEDIPALRDAFADENYGDNLARHLRERRGEGLELSQYRLTRVAKLYDGVRKLAGEARYARFFAEADAEFAELDRKAGEFLRRSAGSLTLAERLQAHEERAVYEELMEERREAFARDCRDIFILLARFLAHAVLRSETSEKSIVRRLRQAGFTAAEPMNLPGFPVNSLTALAFGVFFYLVVAIPLFASVMGLPHQQANGITIAAKVTLVRLLTVAMTIWLLQRYAFFRRAQGEPPRFFAYAVNGAIAAAVAAAICLCFHLGDADPFANLYSDLPPVVLTFLLCTAVAACCDDWVSDAPPPPWWRAAEAVGCAAAMAAGMGIVVIYLPDALHLPPETLHGGRLALLIAMPAGLALVIGGLVPHIYRSARHAAIVRRDEASQSVVLAGPAAVSEPAPIPPQDIVLVALGSSRSPAG